MLISYTWLQSFFDTPLPSPEEVAERLTFHAWEIEGIEQKEDDHIIEVNVLPDTAAWALSHRGVAKNLSVILDTNVSRDPLATEPVLKSEGADIAVDIQSPKCRRYSALRIDGVTVGESPQWLKDRLTSIGQKPINNIVDAANYVMFDMGQPLHAFDADLLGGGEKDSIVVRDAKEGEAMTTLTGESYEFTTDDLLIVDGERNAPVGIAGVKGGKDAEVTEKTKNILIEAANFDHVSVRRTSGRLKLRTDASQRFENGIVSNLTVYGLQDVADLITDIAGGRITGFQDVYPETRTVASVSVTLGKINALLGVALTAEEVGSILDRFGYQHTVEGEQFSVIPPVERPDLVIAEDVVEEIGRIYGYEHIPSVTPQPTDVTELSTRFFYAEEVRDVLISCGFSEIFTSSFRKKDTVQLANALATDKGYLRSSLTANMDEALERNRTNADLLGLSAIKIFEIGTVFSTDGEHTALGVGVRSPGGYKPKKDDPVLSEALTKVKEILGDDIVVEEQDGIFEINFDTAIQNLPEPSAYRPFVKEGDTTFEMFSLYPFVSRDIALWTPEGTSAEDVEEVLNNNAGELRVRTTLFDTFKKDEKISYAFRIIFQSDERTLTDDEVNKIMENMAEITAQKSWEVR